MIDAAAGIQVPAPVETTPMIVAPHGREDENLRDMLRACREDRDRIDRDSRGC